MFCIFVLVFTVRVEEICAYPQQTIDPTLVTFGQICNFRDPNLVTLYFYELAAIF